MEKNKEGLTKVFNQKTKRVVEVTAKTLAIALKYPNEFSVVEGSQSIEESVKESVEKMQSENANTSAGGKNRKNEPSATTSPATV